MNDALMRARSFSDTSAYAHRENRSMSVYTYNLVPSGRTKCTVSHCNKAPARVASGLGVASCGRFHGLRFLRRWQRDSVRCTDESDTETPSARSSLWMTCPQRLLPTRFWTMAYTVSRESALGDCFGCEDSVGISCSPWVKSFLHHLNTVEGCTPKYRATLRMLQSRCFTNLTASRLTLGMCGFFVYAIYVIVACGCCQAIETLRNLDKSIFRSIIAV
jgi:hypothetical protein